MRVKIEIETVTWIVTLAIRTVVFYSGLRRVMQRDATKANPLGL
jgi:hypothetical protein